MLIFSDKSAILLSEYLPHGSMIISPFYASMIDRLRCAIVEKRGDKVIVLLHDNAPLTNAKLLRNDTFPELTLSLFQYSGYAYFPTNNSFSICRLCVYEKWRCA